MFLMEKESNFDEELFFSALADRTRLRLLNLLRDGEVCVCFFAGTLGTHNPKISRHLAYLKRAGLVTARRDGKWMHYRLKRPSNLQAAEIFDATLKMLAADKSMSKDRERLEKACCAPSAPVMIKGRARVA
jgi:ArsR family transcriptional regulator, arsenate/arsenite/antimonite-responsive transcriptional repressor